MCVILGTSIGLFLSEINLMMMMIGNHLVSALFLFGGFSRPLLLQMMLLLLMMMMVVVVMMIMTMIKI